MRDETIRRLFVVLQAAGLRPPDVYKTAQGLREGVAVFAVALEELTEAEVDDAARRYVAGVSPFWPTPGQLLALVPGLDESRRSWGLVETGAPISLLEVEVARRVGVADPVAYRRAYRVALERWKATPPGERLAVDERGVTHQRLSAELLEAIPRLLSNRPDEPGETYAAIADRKR